jgi:hypothetical protein
MPLRCEETHNAMASVLARNPMVADWTAADVLRRRIYVPNVDDVVIALTRDEAINTLVKQGTLKSADGQVGG